MNELTNEVEMTEMPLPQTRHELELLLEALHALNTALDQYDAKEAAAELA